LEKSETVGGEPARTEGAKRSRRAGKIENGRWNQATDEADFCWHIPLELSLLDSEAWSECQGARVRMPHCTKSRTRLKGLECALVSS